jgi:hypothetical protein
MNTTTTATALATFRQRQQQYGFVPGWADKLLAAQFPRYEGESVDRVRCGDETEEGMAHVTPPEGKPCHDCGAMRGEYHVPGCDSEECPKCYGQASAATAITRTKTTTNEPTSGRLTGRLMMASPPSPGPVHEARTQTVRAACPSASTTLAICIFPLSP